MGDGLVCELVGYSQGLEFALLKITRIIQSLTSNLQASICLSMHIYYAKSLKIQGMHSKSQI